MLLSLRIDEGHALLRVIPANITIETVNKSEISLSWKSRKDFTRDTWPSTNENFPF